MSCWSAHAAVDVAASGATTDAVNLPPATAQRSQFATAKAFLQSHPAGGVYTCARAVPNSRHPLVLWRFHLERLVLGLFGSRAVSSDTSGGDASQLVTEMQRVTTRLCKSVTRSCSAESVPGTDLMVTALWWRDAGAQLHVSAHACEMPTPTCMTSTVLVHGGGRENPRCKHTEWMSARVPLEEHTSALSASVGPIHETVLSRYDPELDDTLLLEGLITNFFVVKAGKVYTADDGVLMGSTRALVLRACSELGIPVVRAAPRLSERGEWEAAFVTSAVRVAVGVTRVLLSTSEEGGGIQELQLGNAGGVAARIRQHILARRYFVDDAADVDDEDL